MRAIALISQLPSPLFSAFILLFWLAGNLPAPCPGFLIQAVEAKSHTSETSKNKDGGTSELANLEQRLFFRDYVDEDDNTRLSRIENQIFGQTYPSVSTSERIARINGALPPVQPPEQPPQQNPANQTNVQSQGQTPNAYHAPESEQASEDASEKERLAVMSARQEEVADLLSQGVRLWRNKQGPEAIEKFEQAIRLDPENAQAHFSLGVAYEAKGAFQQAADNYQAAATIAPSNKDYSQALKAIQPKLAAQQKVSAQKAELTSLNEDAAKAYQRGEYLSALDLYKQLDAKSPHQALVKWNIGTIYMLLKNQMLALEYYKEASKLKPDDQHYAQVVRQLQDNINRQEAQQHQAEAAWDRAAPNNMPPARNPPSRTKNNSASAKVPDLLLNYGVTAKSSKEGVRITDIAANSRGAQVGLQAGDVIKAVDGNIINNVNDINQLIFSKPPGQRFQFAVQREKRLGPILF
jgi:tetratricopeptide (TPR) repeat protein